MNKLLRNKKYIEELKEYSQMNIDWEKLGNKNIMITGATGLIGRYFINLIMYKNEKESLNCKIIALSRSEEKIKGIFGDYLTNDCFEYIVCDVSNSIEYKDNVDYIIHGASNTHPVQYVEDPIGTLKTNIFGTNNLLELASIKKTKKFLFLSSFEVYGDVKNKKKIAENDFGIVDSTILRSCYPESKRASESLCEAFSSQKDMNISIIRLSRVFGPTMDITSTLATSQFIKNGINNEDIVLKSNGEQLYSYNYVGDAVMAILIVLLHGKNKEAYNVSDEGFDISLKSFAQIVARHSNREVVFSLPNEIEKCGFSNSIMTVLNSNKIKLLGWHVDKGIDDRIKNTIDILKF